MQQGYGLGDSVMEDSPVCRGIDASLCLGGFGPHSGLDDDMQVSPRSPAPSAEGGLVSAHRTVFVRPGVLLTEGTIVDATIVQAPSSTNNRDRHRNRRWALRKRDDLVFRSESARRERSPGRVHSAVVTSASVHDSENMEDCIHGAEGVIYGDEAYVSAERQQQAESGGVECRDLRKANRGRRLNYANRSFNTKSNWVRARVEHAFGVTKHLWGYRKVHYRGSAKDAAQVFTLFALANFYLARHELGST